MLISPKILSQVKVLKKRTHTLWAGEADICDIYTARHIYPATFLNRVISPIIKLVQLIYKVFKVPWLLRRLLGQSVLSREVVIIGVPKKLVNDWCMLIDRRIWLYGIEHIKNFLRRLLP